MGAAKTAIHARDGARSREGFVSVCNPEAILSSASSQRTRTTSFTAASTKSSSSSTTVTSAWADTRKSTISSSASASAQSSSKSPKVGQLSSSESFVEGMRRVLGSLHIKGITAEKLHRGKTQRQDAPFATCTLVHDPPLNVVIIGSGFAGFSAAIACARQGFSVVLLEKGSGLSPHGDLISFCPNANKILRRWGLQGLMWERSCHGGRMIINDSDGYPVNQVEMDDISQQYGTPMFQGHRAQYLGVFGVEARMLGVEVIPHTEVIDILDNLDRPACITSDGRIFQSDVVLVADGCNSTLRRAVFGTEAKESCTGYGIHRSIMKVPRDFRDDPKCGHFLDGNVRVWLGDDCHAFFAPLDNGKQMSISITHKDINKAASFNWKDIKSMNEVESFVQGWDESFLAALSYFKSGLHWRLFHHDPIPSWTSANGRVAFLGDAIHTYLPTSLQGATASVEDGATLALCLALAGGKAANVLLALKVYQRLRQGPVQERAENGAHQRDIWHRYHVTRNEKDANLCAVDFFAQDAELTTLQCFQALAMEQDKRFKLDPRKFDKVMETAGF